MIRIDPRFNGPVASGNGGYCAGLAAAELAAAGFSGQAEVTLRAPIPLASDMQVRPAENGIDLFEGEQLIMQARERAPINAPMLAAPSLTQAEAAAAQYRSAEDHLLPTCFVCGPARAPGDGLRIFADHVRGRDLVAAPWLPSADLAGEDGRVAEEFLWAALDCPGAFAVNVEPILLGRLAVQIVTRPKPGNPLIVTGWAMGADGRKHQAGTALYTEAGELLAHAEATWILIDAHAHTKPAA